MLGAGRLGLRAKQPIDGFAAQTNELTDFVLCEHVRQGSDGNKD